MFKMQSVTGVYLPICDFKVLANYRLTSCVVPLYMQDHYKLSGQISNVNKFHSNKKTSFFARLTQWIIHNASKQALYNTLVSLLQTAFRDLADTDLRLVTFPWPYLFDGVPVEFPGCLTLSEPGQVFWVYMVKSFYRFF